MPDIYDVNYPLQGQLLIPPDKREPIHVAWVSVLLSACQYLRDLLSDYKKGSNYPVFDIFTIYNRGDRILWGDHGVYECILDAPAPLILPTGSDQSSTYWVQIQKYYTGVDERINYNGQTLTLQYAINKWFGIYSTYGFVFVQTLIGDPDYCFGVSLPVALYNGLASNATDREQIVRNFVDKYRIAGMTYSVSTY